MPTWATSFTDLLWQSAIGVVPLAVIVAAICRWGSCRPATRHALWLGVLAWLPAGLILPPLSFSMSGASPTETVHAPRPICKPTPESSAVAERVPRPFQGRGTEPEPCASEPQAELASGLAIDDCLAQELAAEVNSANPEETLGTPKESPPPLTSLRHNEPENMLQLSKKTPPLLASSRHATQPTPKPAPTPVTKHSLTGKTTLTKGTNPAPSFSLRSQLTRWLAGLTAVRDAVGRLPTFPPALWLVGIVLMLAIRMRSVIRFRRRLRSGAPAPQSVTALVASTAAKLGLRRVPETIMVHDRISPMIWCGRKVRLVLPRKLWKELDDHGRRAVVYHELAHVRRKDHWVCWAESLVAATYWWHPLVWWVRGKMRDEAEKCCDAWVTWLLPRRRRAYAEALLMTRQFAGGSSAGATTPAIGMITGKTKRFARRLTMIMTQQQTPRLSSSGIVLVLSLIVAGCVATPARSAEPRVQQAVEPTPPAAPTVVVAPTPPSDTVAPVAPVVVLAPTPPVAPTAATVWAAPGSANGPSADRREKRLAERMERLERRLEKLAEQLEKVGPRAGAFSAAPRPRTPRGPGASAPAGIGHGYTIEVPAPSGGVIVKAYHLPEKQLKALTKLMIRPDVPIRVRPLDGAIEVHGTEADHARFKAFIGLLTNDTGTESYHLPQGKLEDLTALMSLQEVPTMIRPGENEIMVQGPKAVQTVFQAFVEMINPDGGSHSKADAPRQLQRIELPKRMTAAAQREIERALKEKLSHLDKSMKGRMSKQAARRMAKELRRKAQAEAKRTAKDFSKYTKELERKAERLETEADRLEERAQRARDKANALREKMHMSGDSEKTSSLQHEAGAYEAEAEELESQAEVLLAQAEALQDQIDEIEQRAEEMAEQVEEQSEREIEAAEEAAEAAQEAAEDAYDHDSDDDNDDAARVGRTF